MAGSINKATIIGNLTRDPEVRHTNDGRPIVNITVATSESWRDKATGEKKERAEFHRVVIFNEGLAKVAEAYLKKGSSVYIEGQLQTRKWTDKDGAEKYSTEIVLQQYRGELVLLGGKDLTVKDTADRPSTAGEYREAVKRNFPDADLSDEVPF